jgi:hypothetical protein
VGWPLDAVHPSQSQVQDTAQRGLVAVSRALGHMAHTDTPLADGRVHTDEGVRNMPRFTLRTGEVRSQFCEGPSRGRPNFPARNAGSPSAHAGAPHFVSGLFRHGVALALALMLWCSLALATSFAESQVQDTAQRGLVAVSRALGHMAHTDTPLADGRVLVNRQPG